MAPSGPRSYAWALHTEASEIDEDELGEAAWEGLGYAEVLAQNRLERSQDPRRLIRPEQLTPAHLAARYQVPVAYINKRIALARRQLFGKLSDAAIAKRAQRQKDRVSRACQHPRCDERILPPEHGNRRYCPAHSSGAARAQRHRAKQARRRDRS
jgi:hypothetical protein